MDFSAWNWANSFRLHEAACLIAGVMPISKRQPTIEELPSQARPILVKLMAAYLEWHHQKRNPDRPKSTFLEGYLNDDGTLPEINSLAEFPGALASREAINRFLLQIEGELGLKSAYDFGPICKTADPFSTDDQRPTQRTPTPAKRPLNEAPELSPDEPAPVLPAKETPAERRARWLAMFEEEKRRASRGALQRLADREGVDRSNMGKDIVKARKEREAQKQAGTWAAQLVQNGKRAN